MNYSQCVSVVYIGIKLIRKHLDTGVVAQVRVLQRDLIFTLCVHFIFI